MNIPFRNVALAAALLFLGLTIVLLLAPDRLLASWGVVGSASADFVARRSAMVFLGLSVLMISARDLAPSPARTAIVRGLLTAFVALAALGLVEFLAGHASAGIFSAVAVELAFAAAFIFAGQDECERRSA